MRKHIICFGDSNTHGKCADPSDCADTKRNPLRFNEEERWTCLLQKAIGEEYLVIEEGLSGRTTVFEDPLYEGMSALSYIEPCLKSHEPVDLLIIMLGVNDTKERFGASAVCISRGLDRLIKKAKLTTYWTGEPNILVICPPPFDARIETAPAAGTMGKGCAEKSRLLAPEYQKVARENGCHFLDSNGLVEYNTIDFMHLTRKSHMALAQRLSALLPEILMQKPRRG